MATKWSCFRKNIVQRPKNRTKICFVSINFAILQDISQKINLKKPIKPTKYHFIINLIYNIMKKLFLFLVSLMLGISQLMADEVTFSVSDLKASLPSNKTGL